VTQGAASTVTVVADVLFATPAGHPLYADLYLPDAVAIRRPVIVWLHGGAWRLGDRRLCPDLSRHFAERGFAMVSVDYRLSQQAVFPAQIEDVKTAIRWVRHVADQYGLDRDRIGLWGSSAGAHLGALAAVTRSGEFEGAGAMTPNIRARSVQPPSAIRRWISSRWNRARVLRNPS
jgi:acetyl esterase/lipase